MSRKRALWIAACSGDARSDRLVEIAAEHTRLAREVADARLRGTLSIKQMSQKIDRIAALRAERERLIAEICEEMSC